MSSDGEIENDIVYVRRGEHGQIVSVSRDPDAEHGEPCAKDQAELSAFVHELLPRKAALQESDLLLIRALEDLIDVLIQKQVLRLTDLPESVQAKLASRRKLRASLRSLHLLGDDRGHI